MADDAGDPANQAGPSDASGRRIARIPRMPIAQVQPAEMQPPPQGVGHAPAAVDAGEPNGNDAEAYEGADPNPRLAKMPKGGAKGGGKGGAKGGQKGGPKGKGQGAERGTIVPR